jgi:adenylosuccinate lyase
MIERYTRPEMGKVWDLSNRYQTWLDVELAACKAMNQLGIIPDEDLKVILEKADFDPERVLEIEEVTKHDVIAFLTNVAEFVGPASRWIHYGITSSDILDTATALQLKQAGELIIAEMYRFSEILRHKAKEYRNVMTIGRSHGIHAEPTSFGLKFALWYDEMQRNIHRMKQAVDMISVGQLSGAVGNYAHISPEVEELACKFLDIKTVKISTQVIQRDRHAEFLSTIAIVGSTLEKIALEIRHLQRTEVGEAEENFTQGQKGSSAMPHKRNPIVSEQICGLARLLRSNAMAAFEDNALWHERDISHSSVERVILPDSTILLHYMLNKIINVIDRLVIYPAQMRKNLELTNGLIYSQGLLLALAQKGVNREDAYSMVQRNAMICFETKKPFLELILNDVEILSYLSEKEIRDIFSDDRYLKHVEFLLKRTGVLE